MSYIRILSALLLQITTGLHAGAVRADDLGNIAQSVIAGNALANAHGVTAVNVAAGDINVQANAAALALNPQGMSGAQVVILQDKTANQATGFDVATARIAEHTFANGSGLISINQASGQGNAQANGVAITLGIEGEVIAESVLAETLPGAVPPASAGISSKGVRAVSIDDTAFEGARGIVQVNQSAGSGNTTANNFALSITVDAKL
jgi:hypothetical protein